MKTSNGKRLFSLDLLRGLDMFLLTVIGPLFWACNKIWPCSESVTRQFNHFWGGFTLWDIIMPLFIFMCGAAIPYALSKRMEDGRPGPGFWKHVLGRVVLLWFCGMLVQGNLATLDLAQISPYNNTLETIAAGYLIAALVMLVPSRAVRIAAPIVLAGLYGVLMHFMGDYSKTGNIAALVESKILTAVLPAGNTFIKSIANPEVGVPYHGYTWFLTTLMFGAMTLCGAQCAEILRSAWDKKKKAIALLLLGAALLGIGWGLVFCGVPMIKHIFTVSFTAQAMGWSVLALGILYILTDVLMLRRGWWLITLFGQCALTDYMASHFFRPALQGAVKACVQGVPHLLGTTYQPLVEALAMAAILTIVLVVRRRLRLVGKIAEEGKEEAEASVPPPAAPAPAGHDNGAVADRYKIVNMVPKTPAPAPEGPSDKPKRAKTCLKLH